MQILLTRTWKKIFLSLKVAGLKKKKKTKNLEWYSCVAECTMFGAFTVLRRWNIIYNKVGRTPWFPDVYSIWRVHCFTICHLSVTYSSHANRFWAFQIICLSSTYQERSEYSDWGLNSCFKYEISQIYWVSMRQDNTFSIWPFGVCVSRWSYVLSIYRFYKIKARYKRDLKKKNLKFWPPANHVH